jgi:predicted nuclease of predicted toxin-antitoxin system
MAKPYRLRVLFDEQVSTSVAKALKHLEKDVTHVGADKQLAKGSSDREVAESAKQQRRVLVTFNFDMVLAACEIGVRFIWFDQRKRSPTLLETALIFLRQWETWEAKMSPGSVVCLKAGRQSAEILTPEQARTRASRRFEKAQASKRRMMTRDGALNQGRLSFDDE